jgi:hypothetical protein
VTFKSLLFVPNSRHSQQFNKFGQAADNNTLYVRRVFITVDFKDIMPSYLSFVQGVGDSDDLPLNVSRETLQQHNLLKVRGEHNDTEEVAESKTMVYVIQGDIILDSRAILETLGGIQKYFPHAGQFLTVDDDALTGRAFVVNPDPVGLMSDGTKATNMPEAIARTVDKTKSVEPCANAAKAGMTSYKASNMAGTRTDPPEVAREVIKKVDMTKTAVEQPKG